MIPGIWTIGEVGGPVRTLADWGVDSATFEARSQLADTLNLTFAVERADAPDLWAYDTEMVLRRSGVVWFRGRVALTPRMLRPSAEGYRYELRNVWGDLERIYWEQPWRGGTGVGTAISHPRALLGIDPLTGDRIPGREALAPIAALATAKGAPLTIASGGLADGFSPMVAEANQTLADLIRAELASHPDAVCVASYSESVTTLTMVRRGSAAAVSIAVGGRPLSSLDVVERHDMVCDAVHLQYETSVLELFSIPATTEEPARIGSRRRTVFFRDEWPLESAKTRRTMSFALPGNARDPEVPEIRPGEIKTHAQAIVTRPLPRDGATDLAARRWWYDHLGLKAYGLTVEDIRLPSATTATVRAHKLTISPEYREPRPSTINPSATAVYTTTDIDQLPRELVEGQVADWMGNKVVPVVATSTIALAGASVNALAPEDRASIMRYVTGTATVSGNPNNFIAEARVTVHATDARTKVYQTPVSVTQGVTVSEAALNAKNLQTVSIARQRSVIPGLARRLHAAHSVLHYEGTLELSEEEAGGQRFLGKVLNLTGSDRAQWATMRAQIQGESVDLGSGLTTLTYGPPKHLAVQDFVTQRDAITRFADNRAKKDAAPADPISGAAPGGANSDPDQPVVMGAIGPRKEGGLLPPTPPGKIWDIKVSGLGKVQISTAGTVRKSADVNETSLVTITGLTTEWTPTVGKYLCLKLDKTGAVSVVLESTWSGFPFPIVTEEDTLGFKVWQHTFFPLWKAVEPPTTLVPGRHVAVSATVAMQRLAPDADLEIVQTHEETPSGHFVDCDTLAPGWGAA